MTYLKPCPHCGEEQTLTIYVDHVTKSRIECICGARVQIENYDGMPGQILDTLIELWNRRVGDHTVDAKASYGDLSDDIKNTLDESFKKVGVSRF